MKLPLRVLVILAIAFWISTGVLYLIGNLNPGLSVLRWAALPDALLALVFTVLAANKAFKQ